MDKKLNSVAKQIAKHGRYGDDRLLHVSQIEIDGLASLVPGGKLPTNPKTGLPEAFFFLPFLAGLAGAAAPAAATGAALTGAGLAAAAPAAAAAIPTVASGAGAMLAPAATGAGLASLTAPAAAAAAPMVTSPTAAAALTGAGALTAPASTGAGIATLAKPAAALAAGPASFVNPAGASAAGLVGAFPAAPAAAASGSGGLGGLLGGMDMSKMLQYGALGAMMLPSGGGGKSDDGDKDVGAKSYDPGKVASESDGGASGGTHGEFDFFPKERYYAEGGLASLGGDEDNSQMDDNQILEATVAALQGQGENPQAVIQMFVQEFGEQALQDLIARLQGGGQGDGLSDSVPAMVSNGQQAAPAKLSEGEYVVPSDVVSHLGNGSTQAGARQLSDMVQRTRQMRGASAPQQIDPMKAMPA